MPRIASQFDVAFVEELWRRNFDRYYRQHPPAIVTAILEKLLYGPASSTAAASSEVAEGRRGALRSNNGRMERRFAEYGAFRLGILSKAKMVKARAAFGTSGEHPPNSVNDAECVENVGNAYTPRQLVSHCAHEAWMEELVQAELAKIKGMNQYLAPFFEGLTLGTASSQGYDRFGGELRRTMLVQALTYRHKMAMKSGVSSREYENTWSYTAKGHVSLALMEHVHAAFERRRKENWDASLALKAELSTATQLVACRDPMALAGRLMAVCPTRGGNVFQNFVALLCNADDFSVPLLEDKVRVLMIGKLAVVKGGPDKTVMSRGECWTTCPLDTVSRLRHAVGDAAFTAIELEMHGTWGWAYRESDIPNRHGHCNSNPNADLGGRFQGFPS
jgi:hypothetical protein